MILSDFLTLESYFSNEESVHFFEEVSHRYGIKPIEKCIAAGELICKKIHIGPDKGRHMLFLSEKGRLKAMERQMMIAAE